MAHDLPRAKSLPSSTAELLAARKTNQRRTLNDHVNDIHVTLWEDDDYQRLLEAVHQEEAVEGTLKADNLMAAQMIRNVAKQTGNPFLIGKNLETISKSLNIVLNRYDMGRKYRRKLMALSASTTAANED